MEIDWHHQALGGYVPEVSKFKLYILPVVYLNQVHDTMLTFGGNRQENIITRLAALFIMMYYIMQEFEKMYKLCIIYLNVYYGYNVVK